MAVVETVNHKITTKLTAHKRIKYVNEIGVGSNVIGNLEGIGHYKIAGGLHGDISETPESNATLLIDHGGYVKGNIEYSNLIVIGTVDGSINVSDRTEVYPSAIIRGDVVYKQLSIHPNAKVNGRIACSQLDQISNMRGDVISMHPDSKAGT